MWRPISVCEKDSLPCLLDRDYQNTTQIYYNLVLKQTYTIAFYLTAIANKKLEGNFYLYIVKEIFDGIQT